MAYWRDSTPLSCPSQEETRGWDSPPANTVRDVYRQLRKQGRVSRGEIGIYVQDITFVMAKGLSLARDHGVIVADVLPDGPAESGAG
jgi:serine protease Do